MSDTAIQITDGLDAMGISHGVSDVQAIGAHLNMVAEANRSFNLTTIPPESAVPMHVLDSLVALRALSSAPEGPFADLGSGAGFPGIPLAILSGRSLTLVESVGKKAAFLERVVAALRLKATVRGIRAEELAVEQPRAFSAITCRALSSLPSLVELASPLLVDDGLLICLKGAPDDDELSRGDAAAVRCGMKRIATTAAMVPGVDAQRTLVVYRRRGVTRVALPRRNGMAQRQPLA